MLRFWGYQWQIISCRFENLESQGMISNPYSILKKTLKCLLSLLSSDGILDHNGASLLVLDSFFISNTVVNMPISLYSDSVFQNTVFANNRPMPSVSGALGGVILVSDNASLDNCTFVGNSGLSSLAENGAGAIYIFGGSVLVNSCSFYNNKIAPENDQQFTLGGGAIFMYAGSSLLCKNSLFEGNIADYSDEGGGGAVFIGGSAVFSSTVFRQNSANYSVDGGGGAVFIRGDGKATFGPECSFYQNTAFFESGGAVYQTYPESATYDSSIVFEENLSRNGGAIYVASTSPTNSSLSLQDLKFIRNVVCSCYLFQNNPPV